MPGQAGVPSPSVINIVISTDKDIAMVQAQLLVVGTQIRTALRHRTSNAPKMSAQVIIIIIISSPHLVNYN
jgi:hypothetical protein